MWPIPVIAAASSKPKPTAWNPADTGGGVSFADSNRVAIIDTTDAEANTSGCRTKGRIRFSSIKRYYVEGSVSEFVGSVFIFGFGTSLKNLSSDLVALGNFFGCYSPSGKNLTITDGESDIDELSSFHVGTSTIQFLVDYPNGLFFVGIDEVWGTCGAPDTGDGYPIGTTVMSDIRDLFALCQTKESTTDPFTVFNINCDFGAAVYAPPTGASELTG